MTKDNMKRATLTLHINQNKHVFFFCDNYKCKSGISDVAYSGYHAGVLGWIRMDVSEEESNAIRRGELIFCPECAKHNRADII